MAKVNNFIVQYAEILKDVKIDITDKKPPKYLFKRFVQIVKNDISEPRYENMCTYPMETILTTAFLGILCNASSWSEISDVADDNKKWLSRFVSIPNNKVPIDDTYRRVFSLIDPKELIDATRKYLIEIFRRIKKIIDKYINDNNINTTSIIDKNGATLINIDGKVARGTGRFYDQNSGKKKIHNLETLNVYDASNGISLFSIPIDNKENEIPKAQEILLKMNLNKVIVTMDALHAQHKTFNIITKKHGDFLIGLKGNQGDALEEANLTITDEYLNKLNKEKYYKEIKDKNDNVIKMFYQVNFNNLAIDKGLTSDGTSKWSGCRNVIVYKHPNKTTGEIITQFFVTSLNDLETSVEAVIGRWDVENLLHRYLDISFNEDMNKTMDVNAFNNFSIMNKLCLSLLKIAKPLLGNKSMQRLRKSFSRKPVSYLFSILALVDIDVIEQAFKTIEIK